MRKHLRRYAAGALTVGAIAGGAALGLPTQAAADWRPVTRGLSESPQQLLPATVSAAKPVRVVSTSVVKGRPVVKVTTATDRTTAAKLVRAAQKAKGAIGVELDTAVTALDVPTGTDPASTQQWDLVKLRAADAWSRSTGAGVTVAVIDTGVDASHPDLVGQVLPGTDLITDTSGVSTDPNGHGTHVAGTIAALTGNGVGVGSIAPDARILPIRVLDAKGSGWSSDTAAGIIYAADHGANIINMSLGGGQATAVTNAIAYARGKGVTVIAAAGNERASGSPVSYPGADAGVIAVAATDPKDAIASFSNQGSYVDVAAPGTSILSTAPGAGYAYMSGTSMATPHVAAVAALLKAYNPALTPDGIEKALESSAIDLGAKGKDNDFGYGRIDAVAALDAATPATSAPVTTSPTTSPSATTSTSPSTLPTSASPTPSKTTESPKPTATPSPSKTSASPTPSPSKTVTPTPTKTVTPTPTKTTPKVKPAIKVVTSASTVAYGGATTVTYTVTASGKPFAGRTVQIGTATPGSPFTLAAATTSATGVVTFTQKATGHLQVKLLVPATDTTLEATSPVTSFMVKTQAVVTSPAKGSLKLVLTGATGQSVQVQRLERGRWTTAQTWTASTPELTLTGLASAAQYRVMVPATATLTGITSATIKIA